jgi:hypothetical protein
MPVRPSERVEFFIRRHQADLLSSLAHRYNLSRSAVLENLIESRILWHLYSEHPPKPQHEGGPIDKTDTPTNLAAPLEHASAEGASDAID